MKLTPVKASLLALVLFSAAGMAHADQQAESLMPTAQATDTPQEIATIRQFLASGKDLSKMKLPRLQQRLHRAESFREVQGLPPDIDLALQQEVEQIAREITRREQGAAEAQAPVVEAQQQAEPKLEDPPLPPYDPQKTEPQLEDPPLPPYDPQQAQSPQPVQQDQQPVLKRKKRQESCLIHISLSVLIIRF